MISPSLQRLRGRCQGIHWQAQGTGPVILLLHASPLSLASLQALTAQLSADFCVLAIDTPGYGQSDALAPNAQSLADYVDTIASLLSTLAIDQLTIYGTATGAQIALEYAKRFPTQVSALLLDNACHFEDPERERILRDYFPDLSPQRDGTHLMQIWHIVERLFVAFPWFSELASDQLPAFTPPPTLISALIRDYLRAGADYHRAYRLAFANEHARQFQNLQVPTLVIRSPTSIVRRYVDALLAQNLPSCVAALDAGADRYRAIHQALRPSTTQSRIQHDAARIATRLGASVSQDHDPPCASIQCADLQNAWQELATIDDLAVRTQALLARFWPAA